MITRRRSLGLLTLSLLLSGAPLVGCASTGWPAAGDVKPKVEGIDRKAASGEELANLLNDNPIAIAHRKAEEQEKADQAKWAAEAQANPPATGGGPAAKPEIDVEPIMKKAQAAHEAKDWENAAKYAEEVIQLDPKNYAYAYVILGDVAFEAKDYGKALGFYKKAMELDPKDGWAAQRAAQALVKMKRIQEARDLLRAHVAKNPDADADTWDALAWLELDTGDSKKAEAAFRMAESKSGGKDPEAFYGLAMLAARRGDAKETERTLTALFELEPERRLVIERDPTFFKIRIHGNVRALFSAQKMAEAKKAMEAKKKGEVVAKGPEGKGSAVAAASKLQLGTDKSITEQIHFDFNSAAIKPESNGMLDQIAAYLKSEGKSIEYVEITGHADKQGDEQYNIKLSELRAHSVRQALIQRGVHAELLKTKGYGMYCPLDDGEGAESYAKNRRVQFAISAGGKILGDELSCIDRMKKWLKPGQGGSAKLISIK